MLPRCRSVTLPVNRLNASRRGASRCCAAACAADDDRPDDMGMAQDARLKLVRREGAAPSTDCETQIHASTVQRPTTPRLTVGCRFRYQPGGGVVRGPL